MKWKIKWFANGPLSQKLLKIIKIW